MPSPLPAARFARASALILVLACGASPSVAGPLPRMTTFSGIVVDEAGTPLPDAEVEVKSWPDSYITRTDASGSYRISIAVDAQGKNSGLAVARKGGRIAVLGLQARTFDGTPARIVLRPGRALEVRVVDRDGRAVADAEVHFLAGLRQIATGRTDAEGRWSTIAPPELEGWSVYALKSGVGFDYAESRRARESAEPPHPLPDRLILGLDGARPPLSIKAVDLHGKPLPGMVLGPGLISKPGRETQLNGIHDAFRPTDEDGVVVLDWLPERMEEKLAIVAIRTGDYYIPGSVAWLQADRTPDGATIVLRRRERLSGRVATPDGRPAPGATVTIGGRGASNNPFRSVTRADEDGRYEFAVESDCAYVVGATLGDQAAAYVGPVVVRVGKPAEDVDLTLARGTRLTGRIAVGDRPSPQAPTSVQVALDLGKVPGELIPPESRRSYSLSLILWSEADAHGRYAFQLAPGKFRVSGPGGGEPFELVVLPDNPPPEIVHDFPAIGPNEATLTVTVVDEEGEPAANAVVDGAYNAMELFQPLRADPRGSIRIRRRRVPMLLKAAGPGGSRAAMVRLDADASGARLVLRPTAAASGRLVDPAGKAVAGRKIAWGVRVLAGPRPNGPYGWHFGGEATTDDEGRFQLPGLVPGEPYEISTLDEPGRFHVAGRIVIADSPGDLALGDVPIDLTPPKPYVPPTPAESAAKSFADRQGTAPRDKLASTLAEAAREETVPLLLLGKPDAPACIDLFRLFEERPTADADRDRPRASTPHALRWEFELASFDVSRPEVKAMAHGLGQTYNSSSPPHLVVLTAEGRPLASYPLRLGPGQTLDARALGTFLLEHKRPAQDADDLLANAQTRAKAEGKRVFLIFGGPWCPPCRSLGRFLEANEDELGRHYVFVRLDMGRNPHAEEAWIRFEGNGGAPWYVILEPDGRSLISSNREETPEGRLSSNIGFPSSKEGIDHLMSMFKQTAPAMDDRALAELRRGLENPRP